MYSVKPKISVDEPSVAMNDGMPTTAVKKALKQPTAMATPKAAAIDR